MVIRHFRHSNFPKQLVVFHDNAMVPEESISTRGNSMFNNQKWDIKHAEHYVSLGLWYEEKVPEPDPRADIPQMEVEVW